MRGHQRSDDGRQARAQHDRVARRLRRPDGRPTRPAKEKTLYFNVADNKLVEQTAKTAKNGPVTAAGNFSFAGLEDPYFAAVFLPGGQRHHAGWSTFADTVPTPARSEAAGRSPAPRVSARRPQPFPAVRGAQGCRPAQERQPQAGAGGRFRLDFHPGQAAVPGRQLVQRSLRPQLRLGHRPGHHRDQLRRCSRCGSPT